MRRARIAIALATLAFAFCVPGAVSAVPTVTRINGLGIIDYTHKPTFKVGDYVRYAVTSLDENNEITDRYNITVMIAGQEVWWGERCFYIETWVDDGKRERSSAATLVSYSIFDDPLADEHAQLYMRKTVMGFDA